jgi:hypothetical protein
MTRETAQGILTRCRLGHKPDFFMLSNSDVYALLGEASEMKYRKPKNANGSRARYFYAYVLRAVNRGEALTMAKHALGLGMRRDGAE